MINCYMIDIHLSNACNLMCEGCNHWSNYGFDEIFSAKTLKEWAEPWSKLLNPERINLLGGEPFLNKQCKEIVHCYRDLFPKSTLKLFTNGFLLSKQDWLIDTLKATNCALVISMHSNEKRYLKKFRKELSWLNNFGNLTVKKKTWFRTLFDLNGIEVEIRDNSNHWYRTYTGNGYTAKPYSDKDPRQSWENCVSKYSVQLYNKKLYKCGTIAYLNDFLNKYDLLEDEDWKPYSKYKGLSSKSSLEDIEKFFKTEEEWICNMCPSDPQNIKSKDVFVRHNY
jgi:hypothetical protein